MQILFHIDQPACIKAGIDAPNSTAHIEVDPATLTQPQRDALADNLAEGHKLGSKFRLCPPTHEGLISALDAHIEREAGNKAAAEKRAEEIILQTLAAPAEKWLSQEYHQDSGTHRPILKTSPAYSSWADDDPRVKARREEIRRTVYEPALQAWQAETDRIMEQRRIAGEAAKAAAAAAKARLNDQFATWMTTRAPEGMRKRQARGLLPEDDILAAMADEVFAPLSDLARYEPLTVGDVLRELDPDGYGYGSGDTVRIAERDAESGEDADIEQMERIEQAIRGAKCTLIEHFGYLRSAGAAGDPEVHRYAIRVTVKVGELEFTRDFAADSH